MSFDRIVCFGFVFAGKRCQCIERLEGKDAVISFLKKHLYEEEIRIVDSFKKRILFQAKKGVDLFSRLDEINISLPQIYQEIRREIVAENQGESREGQDWEDEYDRIGLSPDEIRMRQHAKAASKSARTVADVAKLVEDTYFDAFFETEDKERAWGYFNPRSLEVTVMKKIEGGWQGDGGKKVILKPEARVKYAGSGEDVHSFIILDPPEE